MPKAQECRLNPSDPKNDKTDLSARESSFGTRKQRPLRLNPGKTQELRRKKLPQSHPCRAGAPGFVFYLSLFLADTAEVGARLLAV
jgi:hypothetical protein